MGAVSQGVENELRASGITSIERIYGNDRYDTSVKIAEKIGISGSVALATGSNFPDALSISAIASKLGMPILLTAKDSLPSVVKSFFQKYSVSKTYLVGGTGVISNGVQSQVPNPYRLAGSDRYDTNIAILKHFESNFNFNKIYVTTGEKFADALTGAVLAAKNSAPLILAGSSLQAVTSSYLQTKVELGTQAIGLGGGSAVSQSVLEQIIGYKNKLAIKARYDKAGTYGPDTGVETIAGSVIISAAGVTLHDVIIEGDLLLAESIGDGNVTLRNVTVKGKTIVNGGGPNSVIMYNFNGQTVIVDVPDGSSVRLVAQGNTTIDNVSMQSGGRLEESGLTGAGFINVAIPAGAQVTLSGDFANVSVESGNANVIVTSGTINTMTIAANAAGAAINLAGGASVTNLNVNAQSNITGQGQIINANINANNVTIAQTPVNTVIGSGYTANVGGQTQTGGVSGGGAVAAELSRHRQLIWHLP